MANETKLQLLREHDEKDKMTHVRIANQDALTRLEVELVGNADLLVAQGLIEALVSVAAAKVERLAPPVLQCKTKE